MHSFLQKTQPVLLAAIVGSALLMNPSSANADAGFRKWIKDFSHVAAKSGIRASTYNAVFKNIKTTDEEVLTKARYQPEFVAKTWDYL
ncbi:MAG: lytic murein transglycosylase, partial [Nitratireductor sp.]